MDKSESKLLTPRQLIDLYTLNTTTVYKWIEKADTNNFKYCLEKGHKPGKYLIHRDRFESWYKDRRKRGRPMANFSDAFTIRQVCNIYGICPQIVHHRINNKSNGLFKFVKKSLSGITLLEKKGLEKWVEEWNNEPGKHGLKKKQWKRQAV